MELLHSILTGAGSAAIAAGLFMLIQWRLNRKAQLEDQAAAEKASSTAARRRDLEELKRMVAVLCVADRTLLYDRIKHLGKSYIDRGYITVDELEDLTRMHSVYHDEDMLNGNGFLDGIMATIHELEIKTN
ncbi:MAG: hypothetical protein IJ422_06435 [Oscillospiraceae bacterium]|nr:hypothetical protein [Oscillospiraceae bacterium]